VHSRSWRSTPWPSAGRREDDCRIPEAEVERLIAGSARLREVDPQVLSATQPWVLRTHADYYLTGEWEISGRTSADMHSWTGVLPPSWLAASGPNPPRRTRLPGM